MGRGASKEERATTQDVAGGEAAMAGLNHPPAPARAPPPAPPAISIPAKDVVVNKTNSNSVNNATTPQQPLSPTTPRSAPPHRISSEGSTGEKPRRSSFSFLRRSKSREENIARNQSDGKRKLARRNNISLSKSKREAAAARERVQLPPPKLPSYHNLPRLNSPFDEDTSNSKDQSNTASTINSTANVTSFPPSAFSRSNPSRSGYNPNAFYQRYSNMDGTPNPAQHGTVRRGPESSTDSVLSSNPADPNARTESMTNRGRYSYASAAINGNVNSPRRIRRRKDPVLLNILVVGTKSCGKTSFIEFLKTALIRPLRSRPTTPSSSPQTYTKRDPSSPFTAHYVETELDGERIGVTLWDSKGLEKNIIDLQLREMSVFVESKFSETFHEEQKVLRATGVRDTHIHCVFLILDPAKLDQNIANGNQKTRNKYSYVDQRVIGALVEDTDVEILRRLRGKTTIIPVISKADTITTAHMSYLKRTVWGSLKELKIDPLEALSLDSEDEEGSEYDTASSAVRSADEEKPSDDRESTSSFYGDAREGNDTNGDTNGETTPQPLQVKGKSTNGDTLRPVSSIPPQHDEIRLSRLSENVDLPTLPLSTLSPDMYDPGVVGRRFPWGFADPYNADHCDFVRLKDCVFGEWRNELREVARERWYESWRTNRLKHRGTVSNMNGRIPTTGPVQQRSVSGAAAYTGKGPEPRTKDPSSSAAMNRVVSDSSTMSRAVSASDIGVAVSNEFGAPPMPKNSYRGVGTY